MTVFYSRKNAIAIPRLPPPLRKAGKISKSFPGRHANNNHPLRRRSQYPIPFQIRNTTRDLLFGSPSSPSSSSSSSPLSSSSSSPSSSSLSSTEIITPLPLVPHLQDNKPEFEITYGIARLSLCDLPSSFSLPANEPGISNTTATTSYLNVPSSPSPLANEASSSNSVTPTPFLDFLNRLQQGTEPMYDRGEKHKDYIRIPKEYLLHPHAPMGSNIQAHFFNQCYPDSSMYGTHMILTTYSREADWYNSVGFNKLPLTSDLKIYWGIRKYTPKRRDPVLHDFSTLPPHAGSGRPPHCLKLKVGFPIMLLKKIRGVCAGSRLIVEKLEDHVITAREAVAVGGREGGREGRVIKIRRHYYEESTGVKPMFSYKRQQFPVKRAFALAVDDVPEGVMFKGLGLDLTYDMNFPGQLHSALSRCRDPSRLKVYIPKTWVSGESGEYTRNVLRVDKK